MDEDIDTRKGVCRASGYEVIVAVGRIVPRMPY
jgi:hypothetical protein